LTEDTLLENLVFTPWSEVGMGLYGNTSSPQESNTDLFSEQSEGGISNEEAAAGGISVEEGPRDELPDHIEEILAPAAKHYGLDLEETHRALCYAAASKKLTQRTLTATPEEATRLKGMKRLASLALDLWQRREVFKGVPGRLTDEREYDLASQLASTSQHLRKLEKTLFDKVLTPIDDQVTKAETRRSAYRIANPITSDTPTPSRPAAAGKGHPYLAA
jgi:hypothetical protein